MHHASIPRVNYKSALTNLKATHTHVRLVASPALQYFSACVFKGIHEMGGGRPVDLLLLSISRHLFSLAKPDPSIVFQAQVWLHQTTIHRLCSVLDYSTPSVPSCSSCEVTTVPSSSSLMSLHESLHGL